MTLSFTVIKFFFGNFGTQNCLVSGCLLVPRKAGRHLLPFLRELVRYHRGAAAITALLFPFISLLLFLPLWLKYLWG